MKQRHLNKGISAGYQLSSQEISVIELIKEYWSENLHDLEIAKSPIGTREFFKELENYRFEKNAYLLRVVDFNGYEGKRLLEVGCGFGIDLVRFAKGGAIVTGIDLVEKAILLAKRNFELHEISGELRVMDGEQLRFEDDSFDVVYAHGVLAYTENAQRMIREIHRVLKPGGEAILMMYHRNSWLFTLARLLGMRLERDDAPVFNTYSLSEFRQMLYDFSTFVIFVERFPVRTRMYRGMKAILYNTFFVPFFNFIPKAMLRPFGAHLIARAIK
jgi:ubiquinone/menaquinone biosynthesis C-methylase UbiE